MEQNTLILLVEDDRHISRINKRLLESDGYSVITAESLHEARGLLEQNPDLIVMDVMLPDGNGIDFCEELRKDYAVPVIFLSALEARTDVLRGLSSGGVDYIFKPYDMDEFLAKVKAHIALSKQFHYQRNYQNILICKDLKLAINVARAYLNDEDLLLTPKEFALLLLLVSNEGQIFTSEVLFQQIWQQPSVKDNRALRNAVYRLRRKLQGSGYTVIVSRGEGYRFGSDNEET